MADCNWCDYDEDGKVTAECHSCARKARAAKVRNPIERPFMTRCEPFYIVVYGVSRHYGGPEEGGWYYDRTEALEVRKVWNWEQGLKVARKLREEYPTQKPNRFSVNGNGQDIYIDCIVRPDYIREDNLTRPRYE